MARFQISVSPPTPWQPAAAPPPVETAHQPHPQQTHRRRQAGRAEDGRRPSFRARSPFCFSCKRELTCPYFRANTKTSRGEAVTSAPALTRTNRSRNQMAQADCVYNTPPTNTSLPRPALVTAIGTPCTYCDQPMAFPKRHSLLSTARHWPRTISGSISAWKGQYVTSFALQKSRRTHYWQTRIMRCLP